MSDSPQRGKRGPAPSWKLGSTRAIRVPIVLADALLNLARRIDSGELTLVDAVLPESDKPAPSVLTEFESDDEKQISNIVKR